MTNMVLWKLHILFLLMFCHSEGQLFNSNRRRPWRDRFVPIEKYWDLHNGQNTKEIISSSQRFTLVASDILRTDIQENIYLQADGAASPVTVSITIQDLSKTILHLQDSATLNQGNGYRVLKSIQLSSALLNREEKQNKFVNLQVSFGGIYTEERVLMVSFHSGYIFIQTDKPIYNPGDTVRFRTFVSSPFFKALDSSITIDIQNPDGVVVNQISRTRAIHGVIADTFPLSEISNEGTWLVTAKFDHWQQNTFTSRFEVKKYVLPAFNVTLTPKKSFLSLDDNELVVEISARYLYGEPVQGTAYVVFGVKLNQEMKRLPSVKQVSDLDGGTVRLSVEELRRAYPNIKALVGNSVYVKASVLTKTGSDLVEAEKTGIRIVESPYVISFKDMPKYFKPGMPLDLTIQVSQHDGSPARNVLVKLTYLDSPLIVSSGTTRATINMPTLQHSLSLTAETAQADLRPDQQAKQQVTVHPYMTFNQGQQNYLYISTGTNTVSVGERLTLQFSASVSDQSHREFIKQITYLVVNKGQIISAEREDVASQMVTSVGLLVTTEMMPSFRVVAFYSIPWIGQEELVSDSVWIDVVDNCVGGLKVIPDAVRQQYTPGKNFRFQIQGDPGARVSLVAVDNAVYLLNGDRLTQRKIWDVVEHGDIGCTRGGGRDAKGVFTDAGLLYSSSSGVRTLTRQALQCPGSARRRRSAELVQRKARLESHYKEKLQRRCCKDGLKDIPMPYSCTRRSLYITEGPECILAFRYCCATYRDQVFNTEIPTTPPPMTTAPPTTTLPPMPNVRPGLASRPTTVLRKNMFEWNSHRTVSFVRTPQARPGIAYSNADIVTPVHAEAHFSRMIPTMEEDEEEDLEYMDETEVYLRSKFYESWLWMDVSLPSETDKDGLALKNMENPLPDSITEWGVLAISASPQTGFCVAEPYNFKTWKHFFVDLKLPYSVARNEQVEVKAVVHNYGYDEMHVRVVLMKTEGMCSVAFKERHTQEVTLPAGSSVAVPYTIVPLVVGKLPLEVMVVGRDLTGGDRIQKFLRVVLDGVQKTEVWSTVLNPSTQGGTQTIRIGKVELESVVPNSVPETFINVRGNVLADSIDNSISEDSLASLIQMPGGCVEQNLASITLPLIATLYLDRTNNWESVGVDRRAEALRYIRRGYENQLAYRKSDGSYPPYRSQGASTWITAYVIKVFSMAHSIISINQQQLCDPLLYLVKNKLRRFKGAYKEDNPVYSTTMTGGLRGDDPEITLTAFVHIAVAEAGKTWINCGGSDIELAITWTTQFLRNALQTRGRRPYTVAITSYALALQGTHNDLHLSLLEAASQDRSHWPDKENHLFTLEATGYALLALIKLGRMEDAAAPFKWLNSQRRRGGGFGSTQSTMVVLQALSEYMISQPPPADLSLKVDIRMTGRKEIRYYFNPDTAYVARSSKLPAGIDMEVVAQGNGQGILEVVTHYNQLHEVEEKTPCKHFELSVNVTESSEKPSADVEKSYQITIKVRALGPIDVRMVVLDISLPTGFTPENSDLEMLSNSVDHYISNFQIVDNLSDRGSLIIHLLKISHKEPEILIFRLQQSFKVGLLQPSSVTVYEYYNPDHRCSRTYSPKEDREELSQICNNNVCRCTQGDCCVSKSEGENFLNKERETFACKSLHHVWQVKVLSMIQSYYDKYEMEITQVIKLGVEAGVEVGQRRFFMSHGGCREELNLKQGSQYLIISPKEDQWNTDPDNNRFIYMLGKDTWVERWPSDAECSSNPSMQVKCKTLSDAASDLSVNGCRL
ncbi:complement C3-like [Girardinichthys multiradiatus]|uniref:complement C3-like n=1 Tax=Girardinichthys multiradiatus TaxID=208333 RepID=UPI001FABA689|nr:complement C3-like [Girardinichthys multiradiatus]